MSSMLLLGFCFILLLLLCFDFECGGGGLCVRGGREVGIFFVFVIYLFLFVWWVSVLFL